MILNVLLVLFYKILSYSTPFKVDYILTLPAIYGMYKIKFDLNILQVSWTLTWYVPLTKIP